MSKFSRWLFLILALFLLVMLPTQTAFASEQVVQVNQNRAFTLDKI